MYLPRRSLLALALFAVITGLPAAPRAGAEGLPERGLRNPFFAFDNGLRGEGLQTAEARAALLAELGYDGIGYTGFGGLERMLEALEARGLEMFSIYTGVQLDGDGPHYDSGLKDALKLLRGRRTILWLFVRSAKHRPSAETGDAAAVEIVREIADLAREHGVRIALYPHVGFWVERVEDSVRVARKVDRPNVGASFNLCHWLRADGDEGLEQKLASARPHLFLVSINGADADGTSWSELIQPLDRGSFDQRRVLKALNELGYTGPVGLQCYAIQDASREHLKRSAGAWKRLSGSIERPWIPITAPTMLRGWGETTGEWLEVGDAFLKPGEESRLAWIPGRGTLVNGPDGRTRHLFSAFEHGDVEAHVEFLVARGSNSGVYFQERYEVQILDSHGVEKPKHGDCGGIYQRWKDGKGFEGHPPRVNASRPAGEWQTFDVIFRAPRFDSAGRKTRDAEFVRVLHNGVLVHEGVTVSGPTRASTAPNSEKPLGPLMLQGDHGPVAYRNVRLRVLAE